MRGFSTALACVALAALPAALPARAGDGGGAAGDADGDGLSDFHERHKYLTDPASADSDGDGVPDGGWEERREYAYTVRTVVQVLPPVTPDVLCDDYQDARILEARDDYVEMEVIHYPFNTVASAIRGNPGWRDELDAMGEYLRPGPTANWDAELVEEILAALAADGIDVSVLDDRETVERVSRWLLDHARHQDLFTAFASRLDESGEVGIHPALVEAVEREAGEKGLSVEEAWQSEIFAKGMFRNARRGSCTSSAIYLNGCLRAVGVPTRIVLTIPLIDASDERERALLSRLEHHGVRRICEQGTRGLERSWSSHTYNEVWVGGRWRRLNYHVLGQNILDERYFGLMTHVATFSDWVDGDLASTWGVRQELHRFSDDAFGGANPYSTISLSDRFGVHCTLENPPPEPVAESEEEGEEFLSQTLEAVAWSDSPGIPDSLRRDDLMLYLRPAEWEGWPKLKEFTADADGWFVLQAEGHPDVHVRHGVGGYCTGDGSARWIFAYLADATDRQRLVDGVEYSVRARNGKPPYEWIVPEGFTVVHR